MRFATPLAALGLGLVALAAGIVLGRLERASAAGKPQLVVSFGPLQVEGTSRGTFFLVLRNAGTADAKLVLGDAIEVRYGAKGGPPDLLAEGGELAAEPLPDGLEFQQIADAQGAETGFRIAATADVVIAPAASDTILLAGPTATAGAATVTIGVRATKAAGRVAKSATVTVVKTPPTRLAQFYGDGADGPLDVAQDAELQPLRCYTDVLIREGATATVPSGTTIRCTGKFENRGRIVVLSGSPGGGVLGGSSDVASEIVAPTRRWEAGDAIAAAEQPAVRNAAPVAGAAGGVGLGLAVHALPLSHYRRGGGGGSGALGAVGGDGGGVLRVLARGPIVNGGTIDARGSAPQVNRTGFAVGGGAGGGGGGVVLLLSGTSVSNAAPEDANGAAATGLVDVRGGDGGSADDDGGGGGGGGGGLVVFCAPAVPENGTVRIVPGITDSQSFATPATIWAGGGGGGACVGDGGQGTGVAAGGVVGPPPTPTQPKQGIFVVRIADPVTLWN